jgi:hypothetical protein
MLLLKKHLIELVRSGKKTQTIRLWKRPMVRENQLAYTPGLGRVLIVSVEKIAAISALTRADAIADGFKSLAALRSELRAIYGRMRDESKSLYRVKFHWPPPSENSVLKKPAALKNVLPRSKKKKSAAKIPKPAMRHALAALLRRRAG